MVNSKTPFPNHKLTYEDLALVINSIYTSISSLQNGSFEDQKDYSCAVNALDTLARGHGMKSTKTMKQCHELALTPKEILEVMANYLPEFGIDSSHDCFADLYKTFCSVFTRYGILDRKTRSLVSPLKDIKLTDLVNGYRSAELN